MVCFWMDPVCAYLTTIHMKYHVNCRIMEPSSDNWSDAAVENFHNQPDVLEPELKGGV